MTRVFSGGPRIEGTELLPERVFRIGSAVRRRRLPLGLENHESSVAASAKTEIEDSYEIPSSFWNISYQE